MQVHTSSPASVIKLDGLGQFGLVLTRLIIGYLWLNQLGWKMPPQFGCPSDFAVSTSLTDRTTGLCDWVGLMTIYSRIPLQATSVENFVVPNLVWMGWLIWLMEAFIGLSLILGLISRLGALVGLVQAANLFIGLSAVPTEWVWSYALLFTFHLLFFCIPPGRIWGVDVWLRQRLQPLGANNWLVRLLLWLM
jgi:thiosulfate dehydrogenase [quinone] large subunit